MVPQFRFAFGQQSLQRLFDHFRMGTNVALNRGIGEVLRQGRAPLVSLAVVAQPSEAE